MFVCYCVSVPFLDKILPNSHRFWSITWEVPRGISFMKFAAAKKSNES